MPTYVKLQNGDEMSTEEEPQALVGRFDSSRRDGTLIKIDTNYGPAWVNPHALATITPQPQKQPPSGSADVL